MIMVGSKAPDFTAKAFYKGEFTEVSLSDYAGRWVVLFFYSGDFTFVSTTELASIASKHEEFRKNGTEVLFISVDSINVHKMLNENELSKMISTEMPFPMVSDHDGIIGRKYQIYNESTGLDSRARFIIDPDGIVESFEVLPNSVGRNVEEILRQIEAYKLVRRTGASEVAPSGWRPGKKTLKPSPELVGYVWKEWSVDMAFDEIKEEKPNAKKEQPEAKPAETKKSK